MFSYLKKILPKSGFILVVASAFLAISVIIGLWSANYINPLGGLENGRWRESRIRDVKSYVKNISYTWDSKHYTDIAESGYSNDTLYAFFPLFPAEIRLVQNLTLNRFAISTSAFLTGAINSIILCAVIYLFYLKFIIDNTQAKQAKKLLVLTLLLPFTLFFWVPYTEALFISLLLICFGLLFRQSQNPRLIWVLPIFTYLLSLTRSVGVMFSVGIVFWVILNYKFYWGKFSRIIPIILAILSSVGGILTFLYFGLLRTGNFWISRDAQKFWGRGSNLNIFEPIMNNLQVMVNEEAFIKSCNGFLDCLNGAYYTGIGIVLFLITLALVLKLYWKNKMYLTLAFFSTLVFILPLTSNSTGSINRYILVCPIYLILLPKILLDYIPEDYHHLLYSVLAMIQGVMFMMYTGHYWIG
jgi:hypothetical protein